MITIEKECSTVGFSPTWVLKNNGEEFARISGDLMIDCRNIIIKKDVIHCINYEYNLKYGNIDKRNEIGQLINNELSKM